MLDGSDETGFVESARHLAVRMLKEGGDDPLGFGFRSLTARDPLARERELLGRAVKDYHSDYQRTPQAATQLLSVGASPPSDGFPAPQLAAYTALANVLLNLDEVINRE